MHLSTVYMIIMVCFSGVCDGVDLRATTASAQRNAAELSQSGSGSASAQPNSGADVALVPSREENIRTHDP